MDARARDAERRGSLPERLRLALRSGADPRVAWGELVEPDALELEDVARELPELSYLGQETFRCGDHSATVARFRHEPSEMVLHLLPGGSVRMGATGASSFSDEQPEVEVRVRPFMIAQTVCTRAQWARLAGEQAEGAPDHPQVGRSFDRICDVLATTSLRLPSEAEWEYACRAGSSGDYCFGDDAAKLREYAWYSDVAEEREAHRVARLKPNAFGLYDMHGNVDEWCLDAYVGHGHAPRDGRPRESAETVKRVQRGGTFLDAASSCRSAYRLGHAPGAEHDDAGFRPVWGVPFD